MESFSSTLYSSTTTQIRLSVLRSDKIKLIPILKYQYQIIPQQPINLWLIRELNEVPSTLFSQWIALLCTSPGLQYTTPKHPGVLILLHMNIMDKASHFCKHLREVDSDVNFHCLNSGFLKNTAFYIY